MPSITLVANVAVALPGTSGGGRFLITNTSPSPLEGRDVYISDSNNVDKRKASKVLVPGGSDRVNASGTIYIWSPFDGRAEVEGLAANSSDVGSKFILGQVPWLLNADHLRLKVGPKIPMLMGTPGGSGRGGLTILATGDSYIEAYASANDGGDASAYGSTSWVHILAELFARKLNPAEVQPNRKGTYRRPIATAVSGRNPFSNVPGALLAGWNRTGAVPNWNNSTAPIPAGAATVHVAEPHLPNGQDVPLGVVGERVMPVNGLTLVGDGANSHCLVYRLEASVTHVEIVYVRPSGAIGTQTITVDVFNGNVNAYPKGGGDLVTGSTFPLVWAGANVAPIVASQPVGDGASPTVAKTLPTTGPKTLVIHAGTAGPFGGYSLGFGVMAYSGNYDRGVRVVNLGMSGSDIRNMVPTTPPTSFMGNACAAYTPLSAGFFDLAGAVAPRGLGNLGIHFVGFGINDSSGAAPYTVPVEQYAAALNAIIDKNQALPSAPATCLVWYPTGVFNDQDRSAHRATMVAVAKARGVAMMDFGAALGDPNHAQAIAAGYVAPEGQHPSDLLHSTIGFMGTQALLGALGISY